MAAVGGDVDLREVECHAPVGEQPQFADAGFPEGRLDQGIGRAISATRQQGRLPALQGHQPGAVGQLHHAGVGDTRHGDQLLLHGKVQPVFRDGAVYGVRVVEAELRPVPDETAFKVDQLYATIRQAGDVGIHGVTVELPVQSDASQDFPAAVIALTGGKDTVMPRLAVDVIDPQAAIRPDDQIGHRGMVEDQCPVALESQAVGGIGQVNLMVVDWRPLRFTGGAVGHGSSGRSGRRLGSRRRGRCIAGLAWRRTGWRVRRPGGRGPPPAAGSQQQGKKQHKSRFETHHNTPLTHCQSRKPG